MKHFLSLNAKSIIYILLWVNGYPESGYRARVAHTYRCWRGVVFEVIVVEWRIVEDGEGVARPLYARTHIRKTEGRTRTFPGGRATAIIIIHTRARERGRGLYRVYTYIHIYIYHAVYGRHVRT